MLEKQNDTTESKHYMISINKEQTNIHCQLLSPIELDKLQEKMDDRRLLTQKKEDTVTAINRKGYSVGIPESIINWAKHMDFAFLIDGEAIDDHWHVFDIWQHNETDCKISPFKEHFQLLEKIDYDEHVHLVKLFINSNNKMHWLK